MKTIQSLKIENFQSHEDSTIEFSPGMSVIIGPSDNGKSAIVRALKFLFTNSWDTSYLRAGSEVSMVAVRTQDGAEVIRIKGEKENSVSVGESVFDKFGIQYPAQVKEVLGCPTVRLDADNEECLNISSQFDGPFLLSETAPTKAKVLGKLVNLHYVDAALQELNSDKLHFQKNRKSLEESKESLGSELYQYADIPELKEALDVAGATLNDVDSLEKELVSLRKLHSSWAKWSSEWLGVQDKLDSSFDVEEGNRVLDIVSDMSSNLQRLKSTRDAYVGVCNRVDSDRKRYVELSDVCMKSGDRLQLLLLEAGVCPTCGKTQ